LSRTAGLALALLSGAATASAETDLFSGDQLRGFIDIRAALADGEETFLDSGFGKTRFSGDDGDWAGDITGQAALLWTPHLTWELDGHLHLQAEPHQDHAPDVVEAYLTYRAPPNDGWDLGARAGLMFPPVSLEHDGPAWSTTRTLTPSAINTWIGEETPIIGLEGTVRRRLGTQEFGATIAAFGYNDTSGTLLSYRGWALHDVLSTAFGDFPLPQRSAAWHARKASQSLTTEPTRELDWLVGYYGRLEWKPTGPITLDALHYDNEGDRISHNDGQWSWETRFTNVGLRWALAPNTHLLAQAMMGQTIYGRSTANGYWVDMDFASAYVLLAHELDSGLYAGRIDYFETTDRSFMVTDNNDESGWAATLAYRRPVSENATLVVEGLHIWSERLSRADVALDPEQEQTLLQTAIQLAF
jgi:hypothetical protein